MLPYLEKIVNIGILFQIKCPQIELNREGEVNSKTCGEGWRDSFKTIQKEVGLKPTELVVIHDGGGGTKRRQASQRCYIYIVEEQLLARSHSQYCLQKRPRLDHPLFPNIILRQCSSMVHNAINIIILSPATYRSPPFTSWPFFSLHNQDIQSSLLLFHFSFLLPSFLNGVSITRLNN